MKRQSHSNRNQEKPLFFSGLSSPRVVWISLLGRFNSESEPVCFSLLLICCFLGFLNLGFTYFLQFQLNYFEFAQKDQNCASGYAQIRMIEQLDQQNQQQIFLGSCVLSKGLGFGSVSGFCYW